jgi:dipeptidyl aminopeptidase/acylaminoacyl peptidase
MPPIAAPLAVMLACGPDAAPTWDDIDFAFIGERADASDARWLMGGNSVDQSVRRISAERLVTSEAIARRRGGVAVLAVGPLADGTSPGDDAHVLWSIDELGSVSTGRLRADSAHISAVHTMTPSPSRATMLVEVATSEPFGVTSIGRHLLLVDLEAGDPETSCSDLWPDGSGAAWSADNRTLAATYADVSYDEEWTPEYSPREIYLHNTSTHEVWYPNNDASADERAPAFSPDGSVLAYVSDANGGNEILLWPVAGGPATSIGAPPCPPDRLTWLPDGERLLVGCGASFALIDREGRERLAPQPGVARDVTADGSRLLLELTVGTAVHVAVFDLEDGSTVDLGPGHAPVWRPAEP